MELLSLNEVRTNRALAGDEQLRRDQQLLHEQLLEQDPELRAAHVKSLNEMEDLKRFQGSTFDTFSRRKLIEDRDTILELTAKIQELQNEVYCMNDSIDFKDAESVRSGQSHVTSQPAFFFWRNAKAFLGMPSRNDAPPSIWDTHGISGNVFVNPTASSSSPYPQELNQWNSSIEEPLHSSTVVKSERQNTRSITEMPVWTVSQKILSSSVRGEIFKELWGRPTTTADLRSSFRQNIHLRQQHLRVGR